MSGHSKWNNIKHKKEKTDSQRARVFTKIGREIAIAVKEGGSDPNTNSKLRDVVAKAKANNMPNDNISRSIAKASGELGNVSYEEITYEGYGNGGVALIVETLTDNRNRTASDVRHLFDKFGNGLGTTGCVSYMFEHQGVIAMEKQDDIDEDEVMMAALDAGADNFEATDDEFIVYTQIASFSQVREELEKNGYTFTSAEIEWVPQTMVAVSGADADKLEKLVDNLEELDDVQNVFHNGEMA
ncbi:MAG: YebC/PmpR family DNA-binding transcriptional regulator [Christensenellales bacterium]